MLEVTTLTHEPELGSHFKSLNEEWLLKYFQIEPIDKHVLSQPDEIIAKGGQIIYACLGEAVVGCVALKHHGRQIYELTKMAVTRQYQAHGIGAILMQRAIEEFSHLGGTKLYLETHSSLQPAIKLYGRFGFVKKPHPFESEYARSDYYMEFQQ
ncbi:MAG: GNAT family N-acetyltransferase [Marinicella sp.]|nr:GNAT family N-acetyltransferase [Xanthomonadales bacterium]